MCSKPFCLVPPCLVQAFKAISPDQAFKATFLRLGVQRHLHQFRHLKPSSSYQAFRATFLYQPFKATFLSRAFKATSPVQVFRATFTVLGVQRHHFHRPLEPFPYRHSKPPLSLHISGVQSHHIFTIWCSEPSFIVRHSKPFFTIQALRATHFQFDIQSHSLCVQSHILQLSVQSHLPHLGVQSHFAQSQFYQFRQLVHFPRIRRSEPLPQFRRSKPPSSVRRSEPFSIIQAFRATLLILGIQSHLAQFRRSEPSSLVRCLEPFLQFRHLKPSSLIRRSEPLCSVPFSSAQAFKAISLYQAFRATTLFHRHPDPFSPFRHLEPPLSFIGVQNCRPSEPLLPLAVRARVLGIQNHSLVVQNCSSQSWHSQPHFKSLES